MGSSSMCVYISLGYRCSTDDCDFSACRHQTAELQSQIYVRDPHPAEIVRKQIFNLWKSFCLWRETFFSILVALCFIWPAFPWHDLRKNSVRATVCFFAVISLWVKFQMLCSAYNGHHCLRDFIIFFKLGYLPRLFSNTVCAEEGPSFPARLGIFPGKFLQWFGENSFCGGKKGILKQTQPAFSILFHI